MALVFKIIPYTLNFKFVAKTSRGTLSEHKTWIIKVEDDSKRGVFGYGECAPFEGLSIDDVPDFGDKLTQSLTQMEGAKMPEGLENIAKMVDRIDYSLPSVRFGLETALRDLFYGGKQKIFDSPFFNENKTIEINGLIWMGEKDEMLKRLERKITDGYDCIKLKIGAINFADELEILSCARAMFGNDGLVLRVDANGAFAAENAKNILSSLHKLHIHSIEQPIMPGQKDEMRALCATSPIPIALDEELIGVAEIGEKKNLLMDLKPQYIVLKPTLLGGFTATEEWINLAEELGIGWWITSSLESNIGLNAICQFTSQYRITLPQGLGTGELYENNIPSPLTVQKGYIYWAKSRSWSFNMAERYIS